MVQLYLFYGISLDDSFYQLSSWTTIQKIFENFFNNFQENILQKVLF